MTVDWAVFACCRLEVTLLIALRVHQYRHSAHSYNRGGTQRALTRARPRFSLWRRERHPVNCREFVMAPKGKGSDKEKSKGKEAGAEKSGKASKAAQQINVRHILCEKHAKKEEALAKLNAGASFDSVAREVSEDKARTGVFYLSPILFCVPAVFASLIPDQVVHWGGKPKRVCCPNSPPWHSSWRRRRRTRRNGPSARPVKAITLSWSKVGSEYMTLKVNEFVVKYVHCADATSSSPLFKRMGIYLLMHSLLERS